MRPLVSNRQRNALWGRADLNRRSPAPEAGSVDQASPRPLQGETPVPTYFKLGSGVG
jgi:hypothetical protein